MSKICYLQEILVCGKTFMSNCIAQELLKIGKTVLYQTAPVLLESVIDYKMSKQKNTTDNVYQSVLNFEYKNFKFKPQSYKNYYFYQLKYQRYLY